MNIKILCYRPPVCYSVWRIVQSAINEITRHQPGLEIDVVMIKDTAEIAKYTHNLVLPSLVINEKLISAGRIPCKEEILGWMQAELASNGIVPPNLNE